MDVPDFVRPRLSRSRCGKCGTALCERYAESAGIFKVRGSKPRFGATLKCPRCAHITRVLMPGKMDWVEVAVRIIFAMAGKPPATQRKGMGPPLSDAEVTAMKQRLASANDGAEFLALFGISIPPAGGDTPPAE